MQKRPMKIRLKILRRFTRRFFPKTFKADRILMNGIVLLVALPIILFEPKSRKARRKKLKDSS